MKNFFKAKVERMQTKMHPQFVVINSAINPGSLILSVGVLLAAFGVGVILFPKFFAVLFGMFFVFFGIVFSILAYKLIKFKKAMETRFKDLSKNSAIVVQQMKMAGEDSGKEFSDTVIEIIDDKKITWH